MREENGKQRLDILGEKKDGEREAPARPAVAPPIPGRKAPGADLHTLTPEGGKNGHLRKVKTVMEDTGNPNPEATKITRMISIVRTISKIPIHSHRIRSFEFPKRTRMSSNVKTYDGTSDPEDHLKNFCTAAKVERWAMPTWCHMFNSTLMGHTRVWFDELPAESIDNFEDLRKSFLSYFLQQKKYVKDPVELHHIKQRE